MPPTSPCSFIALAAAVAAAGSVRADTDQPATQVPVRRVVLYSSGVGYFEHSGSVAGNARTELRFKSEQINDMLKSLVLQDLGGGQVGTVVYPSQDPLEKTLKSFQVDISGNPALGELLNQLRGAEVTVEAPSLGESITGVILGVEVQQRPAGESNPVDVWVLNLLTGGMIRTVELGQARRIELADARLQQELNAALTALAQARDQDKKPVTINFNGQGQREVRLGYVVETPIWKTSYRLVMPSGKDEPGKLQGWAIVENQTESDWNDVTLSLVSGRPVSFVQDLYQPLYVPRPVVRPELYASLSPQKYGEGIALDDEANAMGRFAKRRAGGIAGDMALGSAAIQERTAESAPASAPLMVQRGEAGINIAASVASMAAAENIGELFQYTVPGVDLPRQRSAMIPIVTDDVEVERLSIYNQQVMASYPLNGARLKNTTGKFLPQGPLTVIDERAYAGDARIDDLPADQSRLLSYAVDLDVRVLSERGLDSSNIQTAALAKGVLHIQRKNVTRQDYTIENKSNRDKTILVEHAFRRDFKLVDTPEPIEKTESLYRFEDQVAAGKKSKLSVTEERVYGETIAVLPADVGTLVAYTRSDQIPKKVRDALAEVIRRKQEMVDTERGIEERTEQIAAITAEQDRIRKNMQTIDRNAQLYTRLLGKLDEQETEIEKLQAQIEDLRITLEKQRASLEEHIGGLKID